VERDVCGTCRSDRSWTGGLDGRDLPAEPMGLPIDSWPSTSRTDFLRPATNTVFMNYSGMRIRRAEDIQTIIAAVDRYRRSPARQRHRQLRGFTVDDDATAAYMDAVSTSSRLLPQVSRFTNSGYCAEVRQGA